MLPALILVGLGIGLTMPAATNTATARINPDDGGIASALVNVGQQFGGSIGTALLNTVAVSATSTYLSTHAGAAALPQATVHGYTVAFWWAAAIFALGAVLCGLLLRGRADSAVPEVEPGGSSTTAASATATH